MISTVGIIGFGLIGSSIAHNIRDKKLANKIICLDNNQQVCNDVLDMGLADIAETTPDIISACDLIFICVPVMGMSIVMKQIAPFLNKNTIITDVGSVKGQIVKDSESYLPYPENFVAGHPMAGTEFSGPKAGFNELFVNKKWLLTPTTKTNKNTAASVKNFCKSMGAQVKILDVDIHDKVVAMTSHLPQLISYMIMNASNDLELDLNHDVINYSANGFHGFARISLSDPIMWRDVYRANKTEMLDILNRFQSEINSMRQAIENEDSETMEKYFEKSRRRRLQHLKDKKELE